MKPIQRYGILLRPIGEGDLERVRRWRNALHVRKTMEFRERISPEMQVAWWGNLDLRRNFYYLIETQGHPVGVVHAKDIDWVAKTAETGIFIGKPEYLAGFVPVLAVLALMDELFEVHGLESLQAKVKSDAVAVLEFNQRLGYHKVSETNGFCRLQVSRSAYAAATEGLREMAARISGG